MTDKTLHLLEFDKILTTLASYASFSAGKERVLSLRPTSAIEEARAQLAQTSEARALLEARPTLTLGGVHDVRAAVRRAKLGAVLRPEELLDVASTLAAADRFRSILANVDLDLPWLRWRALAFAPCPSVIDRIEQTFDERGEVLDTASSRLRTIRAQIRTTHGRLLDKINSLLASNEYRPLLQEPIVTMRNGRYVVPIKSEAKRRVRGIVHDQSASGQTVFMEPLAVTELNNRWHELQIEEQQEIERILAQLSQLVGEHASTIIAIVEAFADIDLALARARYAIELNATAPNLNAEGRLNLVEARHPLLTGNVVPITVFLGDDFTILVITGPNTGGKTVALKTVGLLTLMAQAGMHIPAAAGSRIAVFRRVWADIGDEQSIEQSLSSFSAHLSNIVQILSETGPDTLVLLDELCAGTDPVEGSALARAIIVELLERGARAVVTTHYSELKAFAYEQPGVENASVEFDVRTLSPTYQLIIGLPGRSQALTIAQRLGLSAAIIERARSFLSRGGLRVERLLAQIHQERRAIANLYRRARELNEDLAKLRDRLHQEVEQTRVERERVLEEARTEANEAVRALRRRLHEIEISSFSSRSAQREAVHRQIEAAQREVLAQLGTDNEAETVPPEPGTIQVGDEVEVKSLGQRGTIAAIDDGQAQVQIGSFKLHLPLDDLQPVKGIAAETRATGRVRESSLQIAPAPTAPEIDLRGWRPSEVEPYLERYINDSYLNGMDTVRVVHGHGTGALRRAIREQLKAHPLIAHIAPADKEHGGEGVTVVTLRQ
jgi:DNA mismatch repair protein MutS2